MRCPDASWVLRERLARLSQTQTQGFLPLAPDLAIELISASDDFEDLQAKMREYRENGVQLGWLFVPDRRQVWRYARGSEIPTCLSDLASLGDEAMLPGLTIDLMRIWQSGF